MMRDHRQPDGIRRRRSGTTSCARYGLTLIEVIVGLLLLSTLLTGLLVGWRRHVRQLRIAERRLDAITAAEGLLTNWFAAPHALPTNASGEIPGKQQYSWQTRVVDTQFVETLRANVVRLAIQDRAERDGTLVSVDVLVPVPELASDQRVERNPTSAIENRTVSNADSPIRVK